MTTMTVAAPTLAGLQMIETAAHTLRTGDLITLSGGWVRVAADAFVENELRTAESIVIVAPVDNPDDTRAWPVIATARVAALRATGEAEEHS
jgi:hypothetical protein